jgi:quinol monooxygenase YgiN
MSVGGRSAFLIMALIMASPAAAQAPSANAPAPTPAPASPAAQPTPAPSGPMYAVAYFETAPAAANATVRALHRFVAATRKADGNEGILALHEARRPGRFALVEAWRDKAAFDADAKALDTLSASLQTELTAPFDIRPCVPLDVAAPAGGAEAAPGSLYVLTHVDVVPTFKDQTIALVKQLAADSRNEAGSLRFDALQQPNRPNHLFLVEGWRDRAASDAHLTAAPTRAFRSKLLPLQGALYDERLYEAIR